MSPCSILLNVLVIVAVKTSPRLKTNHHILLASLAGTDSTKGLFTGYHIATIGDSRRNIPPQGKFREFLLSLPSEERFCDYCCDSCYCFSSTFSAAKHRTLSGDNISFQVSGTNHRASLDCKCCDCLAVATLLTFLTSVYTVNNAFILNFRRVITVASISILIFCHFAVYREARSQILKIATQ